MASKVKLQNLSVDDLIDQFDSIPEMMSSLNANMSSPGRYKLLGPNTSMKMGSALRAHSPSLKETKETSRADKNNYLRMKEQAQRVLEHLSAVTVPEQTRQLHEAAQAAQAGVAKLASDNFHGGLKGIYGQYDVDRRGRIGYEDFCSSLVLTNCGLKRDEARQLASEMDKQKTGELEYSTILEALRQVEISSRKDVQEQQQQLQSEKGAKASPANDEQLRSEPPREGAPKKKKEESRAAEGSEPKTESRRVQFFPEADDEAWRHKAEKEHQHQHQHQQLISFESLHNPAFVHVGSGSAPVAPPPPPPAAAAAEMPAPPAPPAPPAQVSSVTSYQPLSAPQFQASLSSMLMPPPSQAELNRSVKGRGKFSGSVLTDHISLAEGALGPSQGAPPSRRILGPGKVHDHNIESDEFRDLVRDGTIQGRRASLSPYWTDLHPAPGSIAANSNSSSGGSGGGGGGSAGTQGLRRSPYRTSRRMRSSSAPTGRESPKAKRPGTYYSYFYGNMNDSVADALSLNAAAAPSSSSSSSSSLSYPYPAEDDRAAAAAASSSSSASDEFKASDAPETATATSSSSSNSSSKSPYETQAAMDSRLRENALLTQVGGRFNYLRHILKQGDAEALSGFVNYNEFKTALAKAGVRLQEPQAKALYNEHSQVVHHTSAVGHPDGKALNIMRFVDQMQALSHRPEKAGLPGHDPEESRMTEERRIAKKVLHSLKRVADPMAVFKDLDMSNKGWIRPEQLRSGLTHIGTPLTEFEFKLLMDKVDANGDGKIEMHEFDALLHSQVADLSKTQAKTQAAIAASSRYSDTYRHNFEMSHGELTEFDRFLDSTRHQKERKNWTHLQYALQSKPEQVLSAFSSLHERGPSARGYVSGFTGSSADNDKPDSRDSTSLRKVSVQDLSKALNNAGVALGGDDSRLLQAQLSACQGAVGADGLVSLEGFCEAVNLKVLYKPTGDSTRVAVSQPWETHDDGGIFCSAAASHHGNDTVASSMFRRGEEGNIWVKGNNRRKMPAAAHHLSLAAEPHKWIHMEHGPTGDLWPTHPRGETFFRGALETQLKAGPGGKAVASPSAKSMRRMPERGQHKNDSSITEYMGDYESSLSMSTIYERPMGRRSRSVPPTARLEGGSAPTPSATAAAATPTPGTGSLVNHPLPPRPPVDISKYASKALTAFVEAKSNMGHNNSHPEGTQTPVGQATSRVVAAQNATGTSRGRAAGPPGSGTPLNTSARLNLPSSSSSSSSSGGGPAAAGGDSHGSGTNQPQPIRSLKRRGGSQSYGPSSSPFATDLTQKPPANQT